MINPFFILRILIVLVVALIVYRKTKNLAKTFFAVLLSITLLWGFAFIVDQFME